MPCCLREVAKKYCWGSLVVMSDFSNDASGFVTRSCSVFSRARSFSLMLLMFRFTLTFSLPYENSQL
ncbi:MAG: hypothetical protein ACD_39C00903G0002 [uncultured bacterium]|nr:MAG: hypothetical protein ACD_39C00903G0002 [uncultured bacterium]